MVTMRPDDFAAADATMGPWEICGRTYAQNPRTLITAADYEMIRVYQWCRGGEQAPAVLPSQLADEPAILVDAMDTIAGAIAWVRELSRRQDRRG